jgi:hypothetical protein
MTVCLDAGYALHSSIMTEAEHENDVRTPGKARRTIARLGRQDHDNNER